MNLRQSRRLLEKLFSFLLINETKLNSTQLTKLNLIVPYLFIFSYSILFNYFPFNYSFF